MQDSLTAFERQRVEEILLAVFAGDWVRFETLSDGSFSNRDSMIEQFETSKGRVSRDQGRWEDRMEVNPVPDWGRLIQIDLVPKPPGKLPIMLVLHSVELRIAVWIFYRKFDLYGVDAEIP